MHSICMYIYNKNNVLNIPGASLYARSYTLLVGNIIMMLIYRVHNVRSDIVTKVRRNRSNPNRVNMYCDKCCRCMYQSIPNMNFALTSILGNFQAANYFDAYQTGS